MSGGHNGAPRGACASSSGGAIWHAGGSLSVVGGGIGHCTFRHNSALAEASPSDGATRETYYHQNQIGMYYALKRNADAMPDKNGQNTAISAAFRLTAVPAFVVDPAKPAELNQPPYPRGQRTVIRRQLFQQAQQTKAIAVEPTNPVRRPQDDDSDAPSPDAIAGRANIQASNVPAR